MTNLQLAVEIPETEDYSDRRSSERVNTDKAATIVFPDGRTRLLCRVINYSTGGVLLRTGPSDEIPAEFVLRWGNPEVRIVCRIAWRIGSQAGCEFIHRYSNKFDDSDWILPITPQRAENIINSRVLREPLIVS